MVEKDLRLKPLDRFYKMPLSVSLSALDVVPTKQFLTSLLSNFLSKSNIYIPRFSRGCFWLRGDGGCFANPPPPKKKYIYIYPSVHSFVCLFVRASVSHPITVNIPNIQKL